MRCFQRSQNMEVYFCLIKLTICSCNSQSKENEREHFPLASLNKVEQANVCKIVINNTIRIEDMKKFFQG